MSCWWWESSCIAQMISRSLYIGVEESCARLVRWGATIRAKPIELIRQDSVKYTNVSCEKSTITQKVIVCCSADNSTIMERWSDGVLEKGWYPIALLLHNRSHSISRSQFEWHRMTKNHSVYCEWICLVMSSLPIDRSHTIENGSFSVMAGRSLSISIRTQDKRIWLGWLLNGHWKIN